MGETDKKGIVVEIVGDVGELEWWGSLEVEGSSRFPAGVHVRASVT